MPSFSSPTPSFFLSMPALNAGSKSFASFTLEPGVTRNGSMKFAIRLVMSSGIVSSFDQCWPYPGRRDSDPPDERRQCARPIAYRQPCVDVRIGCVGDAPAATLKLARSAASRSVVLSLQQEGWNHAEQHRLADPGRTVRTEVAGYLGDAAVSVREAHELGFASVPRCPSCRSRGGRGERGSGYEGRSVPACSATM